MKLKQKITISIYENTGNIKFSCSPGIVDLCRAKMVLQQVLEHNFVDATIKMVEQYVLDNTENIEEVPAK